MRGHITTNMSRRRRQTRRRRALALGLGICALVIPSTATAYTMDPPLNVNAVASGSDDSTQPSGDSGYSSVTSISPPTSEPSGSGDVGSGYSSMNAILGPSTGEPTVVSGSPTNSGDGFDWPSALVGAGAALALAALSAVALLTIRRRTAISPSTS